MKTKILTYSLFLLLITVSASSSQAQVSANKSKLNVAILMFNGVQIIDYTGPYEVFGTAGFNVYTVAEKADAIRTAWGMSVVPKYTFENHPKPDILMTPGGGVSLVNEYSDNPKVIQWVQNNAKDAKYVLSVCNGAFFLAKAGLLDGLEATTTAGLISDLKEVAPKARVVKDKRVVDNGKIVTSGGLSAGIEGALHVVSKIHGESAAQSIALGLEYHWDRNSSFLPATLARRLMSKARRFMFAYESVVSSSTGREDRWEEVIKLTAELSADELLKQVNNNLATVAKWAQKNSGAGDAGTSYWQFTDEGGAAWVATVRVRQEAGGANRWLVTLKIARRG